MRVDAAASGAGDGRRASLIIWYEQRIGPAWREWDAAKWLDHFDRLGGSQEEPSCYAFDFTLAPQGVRADAAGMIDGTGRLMLVSDRGCPTCRRPVIAIVRRWNTEPLALLRASTERVLKEMDWHARHP